MAVPSADCAWMCPQGNTAVPAEMARVAAARRTRRRFGVGLRWIFMAGIRLRGIDCRATRVAADQTCDELATYLNFMPARRQGTRGGKLRNGASERDCTGDLDRLDASPPGRGVGANRGRLPAALTRVRRRSLPALPPAARARSVSSQHLRQSGRGVALRRHRPHPPGPQELRQRLQQADFLGRLACNKEEAHAEHARAGPARPHPPAQPRQPGIHAPSGGKDGGLHPRHRTRTARQGRRGPGIRSHEGLRRAASHDRDRQDDRSSRARPGALQGLVRRPGARFGAVPFSRRGREGVPCRSAVRRILHGHHRAAPPRAPRRSRLAAGRGRGLRATS